MLVSSSIFHICFLCSHAQAHFNVDSNKKNLLIVSAGDKFRKFRSELYTKYAKTMENGDVIHPKFSNRQQKEKKVL